LHPSGHTFYIFRTPLQEGSRIVNYDSQRVILGVVGPTPTFLSQHTCILNVIFSPVVTRGTYIPPATQYYINWTPSKKGSRILNYDSQRNNVGVVGPQQTSYQSTHVYYMLYPAPLRPKGLASLRTHILCFLDPPLRRGPEL
jgi:hypothetical protein